METAGEPLVLQMSDVYTASEKRVPPMAKVTRAEMAPHMILSLVQLIRPIISVSIVS